MTISIGEKLPDATFKTMTADGAKDLTTGEIFAGKKVVLFGVPGAFTPTCSNNHLPGYLENHDAILAKGVDTIAVRGRQRPSCDGRLGPLHRRRRQDPVPGRRQRRFRQGVGLESDMSGGGMGLRSKRFSMIVEDGKVTAVNVETKPGVNESGAAQILDQL